MGVILEIREGPMAGKVIGLRTGESVTIGRAAGRAQFALPHDTFMSGVHFAVECGAGGCRVQDRKSSNGTLLNGARISDAMLANGDEIKGGQTVFKVKIVADAKLASMLPAQEAAPPATPQPRPRVAERDAPPVAPPPRPRPEPAAPPAVSQQPRQGDIDRDAPPVSPPQPRRLEPPSTPEPRPRAAEPAQPGASQPQSPDFRPRTAEPAQPSAQAGPPQLADAPDAEAPAIRIVSELRPAAVPDADLQEGNESRSTRDASVEPPLQKFEPAPEPPARERSRPQPPVEAPPSPRGIPGPPGGGANARRPSSPPPPGVASHIARKFGDGPLERGDGSRPRGPAFSVMGWSFPSTPAEWQVQEGFGLQQSGHEDFPGSVAASEELLGGITLQQFVESQISTLRGYLRDARIEPTMPPSVGGADESMAMDVRHSTKDGRELVYRRIYARSGTSVGVLTVTTLASEFPQVLQSLQPLLDGAAFRATGNVQ